MNVSPYLQRLGLTSGQAWTLSLGLFLGALLIAVSVPPVWDRPTSTPVPPSVTDLAPTPSQESP